ncbi:hypothetical protein CEUSTIGMA_g13491.t1 [Chlamydomonas eustigma]|uniref:Uncharacterized protein n=1 Tax=Chlamydomonas eustigma TaxID=1157962 RepID=A0A250XSN9_9CHLO|nr:hypothetical protein CEUSTIGMA_g13491.t1 [Chlamydomonas eustigma]|eukprot:GAX86078.1 hypothetical protein CEUSTIGMA_g13491.t1 [Chlamydomonas eustigma]
MLIIPYLRANSNDLHTAKEDLDKALMSIFNKEELMEAAFHGIGSFPGQVLVDLRQKVMTGSAYASFKAQHENDRGMRFEVAPRCISVLSPPVAKKSFVSGLLSRISHCGDEEHSLYTAAVDDSLQPAPMMHRVSLSESAAVKEFVPTDAEKHGLHMAMHVRFSSGVLSHGASKKVESADLGEQTEKEAEELMMAIQASVTIE